jgi:hypothetical protein
VQQEKPLELPEEKPLPPHTAASIEKLDEDAMVFIGKPPVNLQRIMLLMVMGSGMLGIGIAMVQFYLKHGYIPPIMWPISSGILLVFGLVTWLQTKIMTKMVEKRKIPVTLRIDSEGISLQDVTGIHGPIPWSHLQTITPRKLLFLPCIHAYFHDPAATKKLLGMKYWYFYYPGGGMGLRSDLFGLSAEELAARIERYREKGLG